MMSYFNLFEKNVDMKSLTQKSFIIVKSFRIAKLINSLHTTVFILEKQ